MRFRVLFVWVTNAIILLVSLTLSAFGTEIYLKSSVFNGYCVRPQNLTFRFEPDPEVMLGITGDSQFATNGRGIRGRETSWRDRYRILTIGGSATECLYLDDTETWPSLLEQYLNEGLKSRVWVGNVGKSGFSTRNHILEVRSLLPQMPDLDAIVLMVGINDLLFRLSRGVRWMYTPVDSWRYDAIHKKTFDVFPMPEPPIYTFPETRRRIGILKQRWRGEEQPEEQKGLGQDKTGAIYRVWRRNRQTSPNRRSRLPDLDEALKEYRENLNHIVDTAEEHDVRVVFVTQPTIWRADLPQEVRSRLWLGGVGQFQEMPDQPYYTVEVLAEVVSKYNGVLKDLAEERGVECIDLAAVVPKDTTVFYDDCHFNEGGARIVATALAEYLMGQKPFDKHVRN